MGFKVACDFRTMLEERDAPDQLPGDGSILYRHLPVAVAGFDPALVFERLRAGDASWLSMDFFIELYRRYLDEFAPVWGEVIRLAADPAHHPMVFHCTGGKDRTGICAALILLILGVSEEQIHRDHDLSNRCNAPRLAPLYASFAALGVEAEQVAPFLQAPAAPLTAMLDHLRRTYGTVEGYLYNQAGVTLSTVERLRANLLA
jgi:protein-tyrosine phosphatase